MSILYRTIGKIGSLVGSISHSINKIDISEFSEANNQDIIKSIITDIKKDPNKEIARKHRALNSLRIWENNQPIKYPFICSSTWEISKCSPGTALHFMLLKQLMFLMFFIAGASILPLYLNYNGGYFTDSETQSVLDLFIIGNIYGTRLNSTESQNSSKMDTNYERYWITDAAYSSFFLLCVFIFFIYSYFSVFRDIEKKSRISDYAIQVSGSILRTAKVQEIKNKFEVFGSIVEFSIGRKFGDVLPLYKKKL